MIYKLSDPCAALECERQRTGRYGEDMFGGDDYPYGCDECGKLFMDFDLYFEIGDDVFCEDCAKKWLEDRMQVK